MPFEERNSMEIRTVAGIVLDDVAEIRKASKRLRDMYGGAVSLTLRWDDGDGASGAQTIDLDAEGVLRLVDALQAAARESRQEYEEQRVPS